MPRLARYIVRWVAAEASYYASDRDQRLTDSLWGTWVDQHTAFAFHGQRGHMNLLKERRHVGEDGYWYAYRRHGSHVSKRYVGRSAQMTLSQLELLAAALNELPPQSSLPPDSPASLPAAPAPLSFPPLLAAKVQPPRLRAGLVQRDRLLDRLDTGRESSLMLISAPAGFGKTTIVNQWVTGRLANGVIPALAWLALDASDADPARFCRYLISACQRFHSAVGHEAFALLHAATLPPFESPSLELLLTSLLNDLLSYHCQGVLVLEDYHVITTPQIHDAMIFFIDHIPHEIHIVLMTRSDPPFPLARWRAQGVVTELHVPDLCFTRQETTTFFHANSTRAPADADLAQIEARLEGWAAGLRMLAIALQDNIQPEHIRAWLQDAHGNQWAFGEYFVAEVLETQPEGIQYFLLLTSVLQRLSGPLCDAVTHRTDSAQILDTLERSGLFLEPPHQDGEWYRYHALFADVMRHEAQRRLGDAVLRQAAQRASHWYATHDMLPEAIEAAFQSGDDSAAVRLIETYIGPHLFILGADKVSSMHEFHTLRRWLDELPKDLLYQHPALCLAYAAILLNELEQRPIEAILLRIEDVLLHAEEGWRRQGNTARLGEVFAFRALIARDCGAIHEAVTWANQALAWLPPDASAWRSVALTVCGFGAWFTDQFPESRRLLAEAQVLSAAMSNRAYTRANANMLAYITLDTGELRHAERQFRALLIEARTEDDRDDIARIQGALAEILYEWNDLDAARSANAEMLEMSRLLDDDEVQCYGADIRSRILHARGETTQALRELAAMEAKHSPHVTPLRARLAREVRRRQAALRLESGDLASVRAWWDARNTHHNDAHDVPPFDIAQEETVYAHMLLIEGQVAEAVERLAALRAEAQRVGRGRFLFHIQALLAMAHIANQDQFAARQTLLTALTQAQPEGYIRLFLDLGPPMERLLRALLPDLREPLLRAYVHTLLRAFAQEHGEVSIPVLPTGDALSPQEQRVLALLVDGRTNSEIAQELVVSINTVKAHIKNLYRKLDVNNRVAATLVARQYHLL